MSINCSSIEISWPNFIAAPRSSFKVSTVECTFFFDKSDLLKFTDLPKRRSDIISPDV